MKSCSSCNRVFADATGFCPVDGTALAMKMEGNAVPVQQLPKRNQFVFASASGIDSALQGMSTDPYGNSLPGAFGLRIPPVLSAGSTPATQPRYLFLLATRTVGQTFTTIRGIRAGATIGCNRSSSPPIEAIVEMPILNPHWKFPDGNVSFHLVREPNVHAAIKQPLSSTASWQFRRGDQAAMLYESATFSAGAADANGRPAFYNVGLTAYTPPNLAPQWKPIAGLGNMKGIYFPWNPVGDNRLNIRVDGNTRVSLYASVLQTNPLNRVDPNFPAAASVYPNGLTQEDAFYATFRTTGEEPDKSNDPIYWRVYGDIYFEDDFGAD